MIYISTGTQKDSCSSKASLCVEFIGVASASDDDNVSSNISSNTPTTDEI
jgi:hypothetical protein